MCKIKLDCIIQDRDIGKKKMHVDSSLKAVYCIIKYLSHDQNKTQQMPSNEALEIIEWLLATINNSFQRPSLHYSRVENSFYQGSGAKHTPLFWSILPCVVTRVFLGLLSKGKKAISEETISKDKEDKSSVCLLDDEDELKHHSNAVV